MGPQGKDVDVESLQTRRRSGSCLDVCLVVSVMFLFVAVTAVAAGGVIVVMQMESRLETKTPSFAFQTAGDSPAPAYKMQNFAYLEATSSQLQTSTMNWAEVNYGAGKSVGSNFLFDRQQHALRANKPGTYFIYLELNVTCNFMCKAGLLQVRVGDKLTCDLDLPVTTDPTPVSRKCWTVSWLDRERLVTQMTVPEGGLENWRLELNTSGFGMFLVG